MEITSDVLAAALGLLSVIMTGLFAYARDQKVLSNDQGDRILTLAKTNFAVLKDAFKDRPECASILNEAQGLLVLMEDAWNDSKVRTPEFDEYFEALMKLLAKLV